MHLHEFGMTSERHLPVPLRRPTAAFSRGDDPPQRTRTREAAQEGGASQAARAAHESPGQAVNDDPSNSNGHRRPLVAAEEQIDELQDAILQGCERRLDLDITPQTPEADLPRIIMSGVAGSLAEVTFGPYRMGLAYIPKFAAALAAIEEGDDPTPILMGLAGMVLHPKAAGLTRRAHLYAGELNEWGRAFARGFLGQEPHELGRALRSHLEIPRALDPEAAAGALVDHHQGTLHVISPQPQNGIAMVFLNGRHYISIRVPREEIPAATVMQVAFALYCPLSDARYSSRDGEPLERRAWAKAFAAGFLALGAREDAGDA